MSDCGRSPDCGNRPLATVSDDDLLRRLAELLAESRRVETDLVAHIAEVDARRLYAREAFPSMFAWCTEALHLSESEAYRRIAVARASREHPVLLEMLGDGRLHLSGIALLAPHLTAENRETLLRRATHRSKRAIEELIAELHPRRDVPSLMRRLPERGARRPLEALASTAQSASLESTPWPEALRSIAEPAGLSSLSSPLGPAPLAPTRSGMGRTVTPFPTLGPGSLEPVSSLPEEIPPMPPAPRSVVEPLAPGRYKVQFTASTRLQEKLRRLRALLRRQVPDGDLGAIIEVAVTEKVERLEARRFAATRRPRKDAAASGSRASAAASRARESATASRTREDVASGTSASPASRRIPAAVRRAVRERDGNRCRYVDASGRRCEQRDDLEYHHLHPFGLGGDHRPGNVRLMCRAHNAYLAERDYGRETMSRFTGRGHRGAPPGRAQRGGEGSDEGEVTGGSDGGE